MKDLFDELKEQLPADRGMKSSKWEILTRGEWPVSARDRFLLTSGFPAVDFIANLKRQNSDMTREIEGLRNEVNTLRVGAAAAAAASGVTYGVPPPPHYPMSLSSGSAYNLPPAGYAQPSAGYPPMSSSSGSAAPSHSSSHAGTPVPRWRHQVVWQKRIEQSIRQSDARLQGTPDTLHLWCMNFALRQMLVDFARGRDARSDGYNCFSW
jgi:hypothetical protein